MSFFHPQDKVACHPDGRRYSTSPEPASHILTHIHSEFSLGEQGHPGSKDESTRSIKAGPKSGFSKDPGSIFVTPIGDKLTPKRKIIQAVIGAEISSAAEGCNTAELDVPFP
ncbi:hypothetical protein C8J56DRAFT_891397 [Mycena floridula]|nr:hypothetical protein C8J56DRAFT_891397 [Mycena floridula]